MFDGFVKLNIYLSYDAAILLLGVYPSERKTYIPIKTYIQIFIATLFIIAKSRKQPKVPHLGNE